MARIDNGWTFSQVKNYRPDGQETVNGLVVHIMDGSFEGSKAWFNNPASQASSHFGTNREGYAEQWVDTKDRAWAQGDGNRSWISVENEGHGGDELSDGQISRVAEILAWLHRVYGVPLQVASGPAGRGLGWHGMGGSAWGGHTSCPGDAVRAQFDEILKRAAAYEPQAPKPTPSYAPFPGNGFFRIGKTDPLITKVGERLVAEGCSRYTVGPSPSWGPADIKSYAAWQRKLGYSGSDADGIPGPSSWAKLNVPRP